MDLSNIAVVILNWNGEAMMRRFLPSVVEGSGNARIIVADNGSTDGSVDMLRQEFPKVELVLLDKNYGFAEGYNRALKKIVGVDFFMILNSDVEVPKGWLEPLYNYFLSHSEVAACQPKLLAQRKKNMFEYAGAAGGYIDAYGYPFCRGRLMATVEEDHGQYDNPTTVLWATGAALMVRKNDWDMAGGFDGRFFAHMEEIDFCWRLCLLGRKVVCVPQSIAYHVGGGTLNAGSPHKTYLNFRNNLLLLYKNMPENKLRGVMCVRFILDYVAALKMLLTDGWRHTYAVWRARRDYYRMRHDFYLSRKENMERAVVNPIPQQWKQSLLWSYYVKGIRVFSKL